MHMVMLILNQKTHYLIAPDDVLPELKAERIMRLWHFFPSLILSIIFAVKVLPIFSSDYANELEKNSITIPIAFFISFILVLVGNGIVIEKTLQRFNVKYAEYSKSLIN